MKRRDFLATMALGGAAAAIPPWVAKAFRDGEACDPNEPSTSKTKRDGVQVVMEGWRRARVHHKPLLVLVIPEDEHQGWGRGKVFGALLNHGDDAALAPFALAEVVCAKLPELDALVEHGLTDETWMVRVDTAQVPARITHRAVAVGDGALPTWFGTDEAVEPWVAAATAALGELMTEPAALEASVVRLEKDLGVVEVQNALAEAELGGELEVIDTAAAAVWAEASRTNPERRARLLHALAESVRQRLVTQPIAGSRWARAGGCGTHVEGSQYGFGGGCGMARVAAKSRRFLHFQSQWW